VGSERNFFAAGAPLPKVEYSIALRTGLLQRGLHKESAVSEKTGYSLQRRVCIVDQGRLMGDSFVV
jgi:hypothetical protein